MAHLSLNPMQAVVCRAGVFSIVQSSIDCSGASCDCENGGQAIAGLSEQKNGSISISIVIPSSKRLQLRGTLLAELNRTHCGDPAQSRQQLLLMRDCELAPSAI